MRSTIGSARDLLAREAHEVCIAALCHGNVQQRLEEALHAGQPTRRRRRSPLHPLLVLWLCLALPLYRTRSIPNVLALLLARWRRGRLLGLRPVTDGALAHARKRLGPEPLRRFFVREAEAVVLQPSFHGRRVTALDGTTLAAPDTPANEAAFGRHRAARGRSSFPQLRLVTLSCVRTHELLAAHWVTYATSEQAAARPVLERLGPGDLVLLDRGFRGASLYDWLKQRGIDLVARVQGWMKPRAQHRRGAGDYDVVLASTRSEDRGLRVRLRLIEYRLRGGRELVRLVTTLTDRAISAQEIAALYHERWEAELGFDEIKTHLLGVRHGTLHLPFRGRTPALVEQELWATLATYNLVRRAIAAAAKRVGLDARQISFTDALVVLEVAGAEPGPPLRLHRRLLLDLRGCAMRRWRRPRWAPRAVRRKTGPYRAKKPGDRTLTFVPEILLGRTG